MEQRWIPVSERLPDADKYILVSFENFTISDIGRYETDKDGSGAFYPRGDDKSYVEYGLFVNAWMPLPEPFRESEEELTEVVKMNAREIADVIAEYLVNEKDLAIAMIKNNDKEELADEIYDELTEI